MTKTQAEKAIDAFLTNPSDYPDWTTQNEAIKRARQGLQALTNSTDEQTLKAVATLRDFVCASPKFTTINDAMDAIDTLSGQWSQETLRTDLESELRDRLTDVLEAHGITEIAIHDKATEAAHAIVTRIENQHIRLDPDAF